MVFWGLWVDTRGPPHPLAEGLLPFSGVREKDPPSLGFYKPEHVELLRI